ncbi:MAG TPA: 1-acyl-sn-glycerol-3-phosphate acyltransferase [Granulicella sp.]|nr:1-acyl-sn-glycerol-3-phosphate acyltransferase [Granulicella sp.]
MANFANSEKGWNLAIDLLRSIARTLQVAGLFLHASCDLIASRPKTRHDRAEWLHRFCARAVRKMKVGIHVHGRFPAEGALITNHRSYLDIVVLAAVRPCVFVSKREIAAMPILGWMTTMAGTVFVERGRGTSALQAGQAMHAAASDGLPIVFFPEGTTHSGEQLLKFHSGLLGQALLEQMPVTAGYIRYRLSADNALGVTVQQHIAWGDTPMLRHVFNFLALHGVQADIYFANRPIAFSQSAVDGKVAATDRKLATVDRKLAAVEARQAVAELAPPSPAPSTQEVAC